MKTTIIPLPFHVDYGGYLQAYALQTVMPSGWGGKSRFETLLAPLGLENHILTTLPSEKQMSVFCKNINRNDVDAKINEKRKASLSFLKELF